MPRSDKGDKGSLRALRKMSAYNGMSKLFAMQPGLNIRTNPLRKAVLGRIRRWHLLFVLAFGGIIAIGIISPKSRLEEWKRAMAANGEKFTIAELVEGRHIKPDPVLPAVDAAYGTFHTLTIKRPQSAFTQ